MTHGKDRSTWPELLYRFVEHYKWERQHLKGTPKQFYERIRRQVPSRSRIASLPGVTPKRHGARPPISVGNGDYSLR